MRRSIKSRKILENMQIQWHFLCSCRLEGNHGLRSFGSISSLPLLSLAIVLIRAGRGLKSLNETMSVPEREARENGDGACLEQLVLVHCHFAYFVSASRTLWLAAACLRAGKRRLPVRRGSKGTPVGAVSDGTSLVAKTDFFYSRNNECTYRGNECRQFSFN